MPTPIDLTNSGTWSTSPAGTAADNPPASPPGYWNAKSGPNAWVQIAFNPQPVTIVEVSATVEQAPPGYTEHQILATLEDGSEVSIDTWKGITVNGQVLITKPLIPVAQVKALKINSILSPSWISWQGVQVSGY
jgi:hypothetical protein